MSPSQAHQFRNLLAIILGSIETGNLEAAKQAVRRAEACIVACQSCPVLTMYGEANGASSEIK